MHTKDTKTGKHLPIWWKSSLTMLQMIQFMTMMVQATAQYLFSSECTAHNSAVTAFYFYYVLVMLGLFLNFFVVNYIKPKKKKKMSKVE
jgi:elongation of very long chain fatty acids protein 4